LSLIDGKKNIRQIGAEMAKHKPFTIAGTEPRAANFVSRSKTKHKEWQMLYWAVVFFIIAIIAGFFGFFGVAGAAAGIAKILFFVFLVLLVVSLLSGGWRRRGPTI
jgi:uncharacterized membrane protein YtjA (UPF0391 family)